MKAQGKSPWRSMDRRKISQQICWRLDAAGKSPVFHLFLCMAWWEIYKLHWCKQIPSMSAKGARSSIEKLFYFTRISEDKCNESLEATLTHTPSIILWVIAGYTVGWKQCLALRRWKYIAVEENFWGWSWKCDINSCSLCLLVSLNCGLSNKIVVIVRRCWMQCICITLQVRMDLYFYCVAWGRENSKMFGRENSKCIREGKLHSY